MNLNGRHRNQGAIEIHRVHQTRCLSLKLTVQKYKTHEQNIPIDNIESEVTIVRRANAVVI